MCVWVDVDTDMMCRVDSDMRRVDLDTECV